MATKKKAKAPAKKAAAKKGGKAGAPKKKVGLIVGIVALVLVGLGVQGYVLARRQVAQNIELMQRGPILVSTIPATRWLFGDKNGAFLRLNGMGETWRFQKFNSAMQLEAEYKPKNAIENFNNARGGTAAEDGTIFILQTDGKIKVLTPDLKYKETIDTRLGDTTSIDIDAQGRLWVVARSEGKIVLLDRQGNRLQELGAAESPTGMLSSPNLLVISPGTGLAYLMEGIPAGLRMKVLNTESFKVEKSFIVPEEKVRNFEYLGMGVDPQGRLFFNDHLGGNAVVIYDANKGKYIGSSKGTDTGQQIVAPGALGVNRYTGDIYVDFIPGVMRASMPVEQ
jgi:hypothetical protein